MTRGNEQQPLSEALHLAAVDSTCPLGRINLMKKWVSKLAQMLLDHVKTH